MYHVTVLLCPTGNTTPFFLTPTSLLLNHSLVTDMQQITGAMDNSGPTALEGTVGWMGEMCTVYLQRIVH